MNIIYTLSINNHNHIDSSDFSVIDNELKNILKSDPTKNCSISFIHDIIIEDDLNG